MFRKRGKGKKKIGEAPRPPVLGVTCISTRKWAETVEKEKTEVTSFCCGEMRDAMTAKSGGEWDEYEPLFEVRDGALWTWTHYDPSRGHDGRRRVRWCPFCGAAVGC
jgi:hypothetical protein